MNRKKESGPYPISQILSILLRTPAAIAENEAAHQSSREETIKATCSVIQEVFNT